MQQASGGVSYSYNKVFTWSATERADADKSLTLVAAFLNAGNDENYRVYLLR
jgi:hypothetical protein